MNETSLAAPARRQVLRISLLGGLAATAPVFAGAAQTTNQAEPPPRQPAADPAPPIVDARFPHEIAPGVFIFPDKRIPLVPNIGVIVGRESALVATE